MANEHKDNDEPLSFDKVSNTSQQSETSTDDAYSDKASLADKQNAKPIPKQFSDTNILSSDDRWRRRIFNNQSPENPNTMPLGKKQEVILLIRGMVERVVLEDGKPLKLGRFAIGVMNDDEIDLTPYGAQDRGVSRVHAQLKIIDQFVNIEDLGSTNGTFLNTIRLESYQPTRIRKGDELVLGRLAVQILFR